MYDLFNLYSQWQTTHTSQCSPGVRKTHFESSTWAIITFGRQCNRVVYLWFYDCFPIHSRGFINFRRVWQLRHIDEWQMINADYGWLAPIFVFRAVLSYRRDLVWYIWILLNLTTCQHAISLTIDKRFVRIQGFSSYFLHGHIPVCVIHHEFVHQRAIGCWAAYFREKFFALTVLAKREKIQMSCGLTSETTV